MLQYNNNEEYHILGYNDILSVDSQKTLEEDIECIFRVQPAELNTSVKVCGNFSYRYLALLI
jgi:hypothetical protein